MTNPTLYIVLTLGLFLSANTPVQAASMQILEPNLIMILGPFENGDYEKFLSLVKKLDEKRERISIYISSKGGATGPALRIGQWIKSRSLDVQVGTECYSSCANYIFLAGANKQLNNSIIGFHGSPTATFKLNPEAANRYLNALSPEEARRLGYANTADAKADVEYVLENEGAFFESLGINNLIFEKSVNVAERQKLGCANNSEFYVPTKQQLVDFGISSVQGEMNIQSIHSSGNRLCMIKD